MMLPLSGICLASSLEGPPQTLRLWILRNHRTRPVLMDPSVPTSPQAGKQRGPVPPNSFARSPHCFFIAAALLTANGLARGDPSPGEL